MKNLSRLVWSEGMYLGPHHFQAQSRYFEDSVNFAVSSIRFAPWGLGGCELDREALRNGTVSLIHARGIFPDGLAFHMPDCDPLPEPRNIAELFSPVSDRLTVFLAVPPRKDDGLNCDLANGTGSHRSRYVAETRVLHDENTGRDEKPVRVARKNIRIALDSEPVDDLVRIPVARVMRDGSGHFVFDPEFIPPCVEISASERLMTLLRRLVEILEEKSATLWNAKPGGGRVTAWSSQEVANFWFLHCVNSALAPLRHLYYTRRGHSEELYLELLRLAGALCTFGLESHPRTLALYDHANPQECFHSLDEHIRFHLETVIPTNCLEIPLAPAANYFWSGPVSDQRCLGRCRWVFAVRAEIGEADLITRTPQLTKVCSKLFVSKLVERALPGMALTHLPTPPAAVSPKVDTQYFGVSRAGPCWDHIVQTREVGVYIPGEIPNPEIQLLVVLES
jgi:type VI secretion system protein ImpJ